MSEISGRRPLATFTDYGAAGLQVAIWPTDKGGISYTIQKRYKPQSALQDNEWKETKSFWTSDLLALRSLIDDATRWGNQYLQKKWREARAQAQETPMQVELPDFPDCTFEDSDIPF